MRSTCRRQRSITHFWQRESRNTSSKGSLERWSASDLTISNGSIASTSLNGSNSSGLSASSPSHVAHVAQEALAQSAQPPGPSLPPSPAAPQLPQPSQPACAPILRNTSGGTSPGGPDGS